MKSKILIKNGLLFNGDKDVKAETKNILIENGVIQKNHLRKSY